MAMTMELPQHQQALLLLLPPLHSLPPPHSTAIATFQISNNLRNTGLCIPPQSCNQLLQKTSEIYIKILLLRDS